MRVSAYVPVGVLLEARRCVQPASPSFPARAHPRGRACVSAQAYECVTECVCVCVRARVRVCVYVRACE